MIELCRTAKFAIGTPVEHRRYGFKGVVFDVDPEFANSDEWYESIPDDARPDKDQPFYHLYAISSESDSPYIAYVSEQNLKQVAPGDEIDHPAIAEHFTGSCGGVYLPRQKAN